MRTILAGGLITQLSGCQYFLCAIIMEIKDAQNIGSTQHTEGRLNLNFQAHPYGVAFLNH